MEYNKCVCDQSQTKTQCVHVLGLTLVWPYSGFSCYWKHFNSLREARFYPRQFLNYATERAAD